MSNRMLLGVLEAAVITLVSAVSMIRAIHLMLSKKQRPEIRTAWLIALTGLFESFLLVASAVLFMPSAVRGGHLFDLPSEPEHQQFGTVVMAVVFALVLPAFYYIFVGVWKFARDQGGTQQIYCANAALLIAYIIVFVSPYVGLIIFGTRFFFQ